MPRGLDRYDEARLQQRLWTPAVLRPALWLDASDLSTISIGTGVSEWRDKSGNGRHVSQGTGGTQPTLTQNGLNGLPVLSFNGSQYLTSISAASVWNFLHNTNGSSIFAVWRAGNVADPNALYGLLGTSGLATANIGFSLFWDDRVSSTRNEKFAAQATRGVSGTSSLTNLSADLAHPPNNPTIISHIGDPGNATASARSAIRVNSASDIANNVETSAASASNASFTLQIGAAGNNAQPLVGYIAEIIVLPSAIPGSQQRRRVEGYLAWKWGLQDRLPSATWFRDRPPLIGDN
jgi:hypothetical protein